MDFIYLVSVVMLYASSSCGQNSRGCSIEPADVAFVLDSSYSIWPPDFYREVTFMEKVIETFNVGPGPNDSRIAALTYGHMVWPKFYLNTFFDKARMMRATANIKYGEGKTTNTGDALSFTRDVILRERAGARANSTKIVVVVTDGMSQKTWFTQEMAQKLHGDGTYLFAVSVGLRRDDQELAGIASDPDGLYLFSIDKYSNMSYIKRTMENRICGDASPTVQDVWGDDNTTDPGLQEFKAKEEVLILDCDGKAADIFFVIDASFSITTENFAREMEFIHGVVEILDVSPNKTRVGLMTFSDDADILIRLDHNVSKQQFMTYSNNAKYAGGGTDTANALRKLREEGFYGPNVEDRDTVARIAIILTDGLSITPETTAMEANMLRKVGVQIFSIGIGDGIDKKELIDIASEPVDKFLLHVDDFGALMSIRLKLAARSCTVEPTNGKPFAGDDAACHPMKDTDMLFVFDALSLGSWRSQTISQFIQKGMESFNLATDRFRVGREIENCPRGNVALGGAMNAADFGTLHFYSFTDLLKKVHRTKFTEENGGRPNATKMVVIFVDASQQMSYDTYLAAKDIKDKVDFFYVVSFGKGTYNKYFEDLAGPQYTLKTDYDALIGQSNSLMSTLCDFFFTSSFASFDFGGFDFF